MAKKFVRTITDTKLKGKDIEPLITNKQNDLLSDEHDVYVRNKDYYHCLTNAIQKIESKNDSIIVSKKDKNTVVLEYTGGGGTGGGEVIPVTIESLSKYIDVEEIEENHFQLSTEQLEIELEEIRKLIENMGDGGDDFLGDFHDYDFKDILTNDKIQNYEVDYVHSGYLNANISKDTGKVIFNIDQGFSQGSIYLHKITTNDIEDTARKNLVISFINNTKKELPLKITDLYFPGGQPRYENELQYINGDIKLKPKDITDVKFTFYTDPNSKVIRGYIKELE